MTALVYILSLLICSVSTEKKLSPRTYGITSQYILISRIISFRLFSRKGNTTEGHIESAMCFNLYNQSVLLQQCYSGDLIN